MSGQVCTCILLSVSHLSIWYICRRIIDASQGVHVCPAVTERPTRHFSPPALPFHALYACVWNVFGNICGYLCLGHIFAVGEAPSRQFISSVPTTLCPASLVLFNILFAESSLSLTHLHMQNFHLQLLVLLSKCSYCCWRYFPSVYTFRNALWKLRDVLNSKDRKIAFGM